MKKKIGFQLLFFLFFIGLHVRAQIPTKCFEIESILVDACVPGGGCTNAASAACSCEGKNEMVRFKTGQNPIDIANISITWPNNNYLGLVQNALTASLTAQLNATIQSCGHLIEPPAGIIPMGKEVLLITSTDMCTTANSFANLSDTLYVIFQNPNNYQGHFANTNNSTTVTLSPTGAPSFRTLIMSYTPTGCSDTVTYDRSLLVNVMGTYGGSTAQNDGSTVQFSWPGAPLATYVNYGCQAPFIPMGASVTGGGNVCSNGTINLVGTPSGNYVSVFWSGGTGFFSPANAVNTQYTPGAGDNGNTMLTFFVIGACGDTVSVNVSVNVIAAPTAQITANGPTTICPGDSVQLTASGGTTYLWSNNATTSSIYANAAGTYAVIATTTCGSDTASIIITSSTAQNAQITASGPTTFCAGNNVTLTASGGTSYVWSTAATTASITVNTSGTYTVTTNTTCGSDTETITVTVLPLPTAVVTSGGPTAICQGDSVQLIASGGASYLWSTGASSATIFANAAGTYTVAVSNACGVDTATMTVSILPNPVAAIVGNTVICAGDNAVLVASGGGNYLWSNGATTNSITVFTGGNYYVVANNGCGSDTAFLTVTVDQVNANFSSDVNAGIVPLPVNFTDGSSSSITSWQWNFGDNSAPSSATDPSHTYTTGGTFVVVLVVTDALGCSDTAESTIIVNETASTLTVPNVFTPNGDGTNDAFFVTSTGIKDFEMKIFDRWGVLLYQSSNVMEQWDGRTTSGMPASDGTYYYILSAKGYDSKEYKITGFLTLIH